MPEARTLFLNGTIAEESWFDDDVTPQLFKDELMAGSGDITVWINSPGGDCVAAAQIYNMLMDYKGNVTVVINEEQAKVVRRIYGLFLQGKSPYVIAKQLTEEGIPTPGGKKVWGKAVVQSILTNEKYKGDALLQKVYTTDFLSHKKKINEGEVPQYYVEGNHPAIIEPAIFDKVQLLMKARCPGKNRNSSVNIFSSKIM